MIQRRQIAIAYTFAVPILFGFLMFEVGALYRLDTHERAIVQFAAALSDCDSLTSALRDADRAVQGYLASGSPYDSSAYAEATSRLGSSLKNIGDASKGDPDLQSKVQALEETTAKRFALLQRAMDSRSNSHGEKGSAADISDASLSAEIATAITSLRAAAEARVHREQASAVASAATVDSLIKYGGVVTIWIVGVAALLLFYDHSEISRDRIAQRLHTDVLESLPFGVFLTTESGVVLYANRAAEKAFGYDSGELVAHSIARVQDTGDGLEASLIEILARLMPGELWSGEVSFCTKDRDTIRGTSWIASIRVGQRDCRLVVHGAVMPSTATQQTYANSLMQQSEAAAQTAGRPRAAAPAGLEQTIQPDPEAIAASHHAK